ncbi:hypothetical protein CPJCM30710_17500 [Clostridium polyendosporum]|uniref:PucR family transcriptional regulator n=1 Tax=Clostridium polyendosporum TaxID=69208 RepID=A0A919VEF1_9CLOT|nr:PucR family transcriptional regulator [Clostridium polyendosporum]GIM29084.1 hypothetical protein CPJCM30710_17500 [Clostridium polyendosporum]
MSVTLGQLINLSQLANMKLIAGSQGLKGDVRWTHILEDENITSFVEDGELIFTTGVGFKHGKDSLFNMVERLYHKNTSGIVLNVGPYIPQIPAEIIAFGEAKGFPIFQLPWESRIADITRAICEYIIKDNDREKSIEDIIKNIIFLKDLDKEKGLMKLERCGYNTRHNFCVMLAEVSEDSQYIKEEHIYNIYKFIKFRLSIVYEKFLSFVQDNKIIFILPQRKDEIFSDKGIAQEIIDGVNTKFKDTVLNIGFGRYYLGIDNMDQSYKDALKVVQVSSRRENNIDIWEYDDLGVYKLLINLKESAELKEFYEETLLKLDEYDAIHSTNYIEILKCFLSENRSINEVSKKMYLHRNTVAYKIKRIEEILQCDLSSLNDTFKVMLSIMIKDIV